MSRTAAAMEHLRREKLWVGLGLAFVALVIFLSVTPDPVPGTWT